MRLSCPRTTGSLTTWRSAAREIAVLGVGLLIYQASRLLGGHDVPTAHLNAARLRELQQAMQLPSEAFLQKGLLQVEQLVVASNTYYAAAHLPVTAVALLWLFLRRTEHYRRTRHALLLSTGSALLLYVLLPVAPPRMLPGFVDTAALHGQSMYGEAASTWVNQYAAFPSLHVGWAVLVAVACTSASSVRWRWLWWAHPIVTVLVVVGTANHFWLDAIAAAGLVLGSWAVAGRRRPQTVPACDGRVVKRSAGLAGADLCHAPAPAPKATSVADGCDDVRRLSQCAARANPHQLRGPPPARVGPQRGAELGPGRTARSTRSAPSCPAAAPDLGCRKPAARKPVSATGPRRRADQSDDCQTQGWSSV